VRSHRNRKQNVTPHQQPNHTAVPSPKKTNSHTETQPKGQTQPLIRQKNGGPGENKT